VEGRLLLDVVIRKSAAILQLLAGEDQSLLVWRDPFFVLDLGLHVLDGVGGLDLEGDGLSSQSLDEDLHATSESEDEMKGRLLLDVIVGEGSTILELFASEDESLLVWRDAFFILDLSLDILNGVGGFDLKSDGLAGQRFHEDLHTTSKAENQVKGGLLLDVVVGQGAAVFELLAGEDESLLVWRDSLLVLDFRLHVFDGVGGFDFQGDGFAGQGLDEDLHASSKSEDEMEGGLLLDVIIGEGSAILELFASEDESLLIWGNSFLVLDLGLDILNGVGGLDLKGDRLAGESLDKDLHASSKSKDEMEGGLLLDVVVRKSSAVFELLASEDESLLVWRDALLVLDLGLDVLDGIRSLDLEGDGLAREGLHENLHPAD